jgi:hypothetical protein
MESELEPKTSSELRQLIAELSSLSPNVFRLHKIGGIGNFTATMIADRFQERDGPASEIISDARCGSIASTWRCPLFS